MRKTYKYKFKVGYKVYLTNSYSDIKKWLDGCLKNKWNAYAYDFESRTIDIAMNGKLYFRRFGSKKMRAMKDQHGKIFTGN